MNYQHSWTAGLLAAVFGAFLIGSIAGCSGGGVETPPGDPVVRRKAKEDMLKGITGSGKTGKSKKPRSATDLF